MEWTIRPDEVSEKDRRIYAFLQERGLDALVLSTTANFSWAACGRENRVAKGTDAGVGHALYTLDGGKYLLCDNIEEPRLRDEERLEEQGFRFVTAPWYQWNPGSLVRSIVGENARLATDLLPLPNATVLPARDLANLRFVLTQGEQERYAWLGKTASEALETTAQAIEAGMTEQEVGAVLDHFLADEGVIPHLTLVASDERIANYRHPLPTAKAVENCVMLVTGAKAFGLMCSATRIVHFGPISDDLQRRHEAVCYVDTVFIQSTRPGANAGEVFARAQAAYADRGFADEWTRHHQGGATGYAGRDYRAAPGSTETVLENQAFAWNPSIAGTKSEDTIIAGANGPRVLTAPISWPTLTVETEWGTMERAAIQEM